MQKGKFYEELGQEARAVLAQNSRIDHTVPSQNNYPHQWLWDSAFIAIGLAHVDPRAAATELHTLLQAQWENGMVPNIRFTNEWQGKKNYDRFLWARSLTPDVNQAIATSTITQPPILAEATLQVATKLSQDDETRFLEVVVPKLVRYHQWIYDNRDIDNSGLMTAIHPWETGLDNTPSSMQKLRDAEGGPMTDKVTYFFAKIAKNLRRDLNHLDEDERMLTTDGILCFKALGRLLQYRYNLDKLRNNHSFLVQDIVMNSILARNNTVLLELTTKAGVTLPDSLCSKMAQTNNSIQSLWDNSTGLFYSKDATTGQLLKQQSIGGVIPLYSAAINEHQTSKILEAIEDPRRFATGFPIPSVPLNSPEFDEKRFWSGPTWVNTNWLVIQGLRRSGNTDIADELTEKTLAMISDSAMSEYFSPLSGEGLGIKNFSWTAALTIDLLETTR